MKIQNIEDSYLEVKEKLIKTMQDNNIDTKEKIIPFSIAVVSEILSMIFTIYGGVDPDVQKYIGIMNENLKNRFEGLGNNITVH